ncbi:hypothetical protein AcV5_002547 [Taiwanofungus camphoratus]|nr:hypothetical protein AcV5_002547 [Antrodia cinnamomea]
MIVGPDAADSASRTTQLHRTFASGRAGHNGPVAPMRPLSDSITHSTVRAARIVICLARPVLDCIFSNENTKGEESTLPRSDPLSTHPPARSASHRLQNSKLGTELLV